MHRYTIEEHFQEKGLKNFALSWNVNVVSTCYPRIFRRNQREKRPIQWRETMAIIFPSTGLEKRDQ